MKTLLRELEQSTLSSSSAGTLIFIQTTFNKISVAVIKLYFCFTTEKILQDIKNAKVIQRLYTKILHTLSVLKNINFYTEMKMATPAYPRWGMETQLCQTDPDQASKCLDQVLLEFKEEIKALGEEN